MNVQFELDGTDVTVELSPAQPLRDVLRNQFGKTCVKRGCDSGRCGACTILLDGKPVKSCLVMSGKVEGCSVETVDSVLADGELHAVQEAFKTNFSSQCGYCTPGFIMNAVQYVESEAGSEPNRKAIKNALKGNVCRCTGYEKIVDAVEDAVSQRKELE